MNALTDKLIVVNLAAIHAKRVTIQQRDMHLINRLRRNMTGLTLGAVDIA